MSSGSSAPPLPGSNAADAERRRARALRALEERLGRLDAETGEAMSPVPSGAPVPMATSGEYGGNAGPEADVEGDDEPV